MSLHLPLSSRHAPATLPPRSRHAPGPWPSQWTSLSDGVYRVPLARSRCRAHRSPPFALPSCPWGLAAPTGGSCCSSAPALAPPSSATMPSARHSSPSKTKKRVGRADANAIATASQAACLHALELRACSPILSRLTWTAPASPEASQTYFHPAGTAPPRHPLFPSCARVPIGLLPASHAAS